MWFAIAARHRALCLGLVLLAIAPVRMPIAQAQRPEPVAATGDTTAAKALVVLEKHCASCHQSERTAPAPPKSALRAILDLDALAREPGWVLPGNPDGSRLVQMMMWRHLDPKPPEPNSAVEITPEETSAVRAWVKGLPRAAPAASFVRSVPGVRGASEMPRPPDILLLADAPSVRVGDKVSFTVTTDKDCHLTVVNVDTLGRGTVIFPNEFEPDGRVAAGRTLRLPPEGAGYEFRARQQGTEALVATCNPVSAWTAGISHDFERQRFTVLGDYEEFVRKSLAPEAATAPLRPARRRVARRGKPPPPPPARPLAGQVGRTGILVEIR